MKTVEVNRFNSENVQHFLIPDLPKRISILDNEEYLFLPTDWANDEELVFLKFRAEQKGYKIDYADSAPKSSIKIIFNEIESAIEQITELKIEDYSIQNRSTKLYYTRVIYAIICHNSKIELTSVSERINCSKSAIGKMHKNHKDLFRFLTDYRRTYNDIMQILTNNQVIERL